MRLALALMTEVAAAGTPVAVAGEAAVVVVAAALIGESEGTKGTKSPDCSS